MNEAMEAIYENGKLGLPTPLCLPEKAHVRVKIDSGDVEHENWLELSRASLVKTWGNGADVVFHKLLMK